MAQSPTFVKNFKTKIAATLPYSFTPTSPTRVYSVYCKDSTGAGTATVTGRDAGAGAAVSLQNFSFSYSLNWINTGIETTSGYEQIKYGIYPTISPITIKFSGTFPLANDVDVSFDLIPFNVSGFFIEPKAEITVALTSGSTLTQACNAVLQAIIDAYQFDTISLDSSSGYFFDNLLDITYSYDDSGTQVVRTFNTDLDANIRAGEDYENEPAFPTFATFNSVSVSNGFKYSLPTKVIDGVSYENINVATIATEPFAKFDRSANDDTAAGTGVNVTPDPASANTNDYWDLDGGNAGTSGDPYPLHPDLKTKLLALIGDKSPVQFHDGNMTPVGLLTVEDFPSPPTISSASFAGASESIDLFDDTNLPVKVTDAQGNKFYPLDAGQKITITAPEASSVIVVYSEE